MGRCGGVDSVQNVCLRPLSSGRVELYVVLPPFTYSRWAGLFANSAGSSCALQAVDALGSRRVDGDVFVFVLLPRVPGESWFLAAREDDVWVSDSYMR